MRRREVIGLAAGAAAWPLAARAQQPDRMRRIGVIMNTIPDDPESQLRLAAFVQALEQAGWALGSNLQIDTRWTRGVATQTRRVTEEILGLSPDLVLAAGRASVVVQEILRARRGIPIVFVQAVDPVGVGYITRMTRPGGDATGFTQFEYTLAGKWLQLLKDVVPGTTHAAILREPGTAGIGQWAVIQAAASPLAMELMSNRQTAGVRLASSLFNPLASLHTPDQRRKARGVWLEQQNLRLLYVGEVLAERISNVCFMGDEQVVSSGCRRLVH